ncbi:MAG: DNA translocase FtsK [Chloroflexi bacterium]|nr:DNA translocase FtsK [Chloroflexota bacterium]
MGRVEVQQPDKTLSPDAAAAYMPVTQASADEVIRALDDAPPEFDFWQDLRESMPPWISEVVGFALIVFGILSFISLFVAGDALVAVSWAAMLTSLCGDGAIFVAGALFAMGAVLWLPKAGIRLLLTAGQMLALELAFLSLLAILHLGSGESELRALARSGGGGGMIGWGLSYPFYWILGRELALGLFGLVVGVSSIFALGLRGSALAKALARLGDRLQQASKRAGPETPPPSDRVRALYKQLVEQPGYRKPIMRIRPNPGSLPEQPGLQPESSGAAGSVIERIRPNPARPRPAPDVDSPTNSFSEPAVSEARKAIETVQKRRARNAARRSQNAPVDSAEIWRNSLPDIDCLTALDLNMPDAEETGHNAQLIENTLLEFDLDVTVAAAQVGPTVTRYALQPHKDDGTERVRMSKIASYSRDLALALAAKRLRMETPVPGTNFMGIEVPNREPSTVALRNVLQSEDYRQQAAADAGLLIPLGRDVTGAPVAFDLAQMPHLLIAGATGSGKSVCMAAIATALLMRFSPADLRLVMLDPKMVELARFNGIPHLLGPVEIVPERIVGVLNWCVREMERRYKLLEQRGAKQLDAYNAGLNSDARAAERLPRIVILIDEIGDLMLTSPEETQESVGRLAQKARAVGMHLIVATQRPSVNIITGVIKANFPARIGFAVASGGDSRVIIDRAGAENLLGRGDMLFASPDAAAPRRLQGCFVSEDDVREVVQHWRDELVLRKKAGVLPAKISAPWEGALKRRQLLSETDPMLEDVLRLVTASGEASASLLQRKLGLGYPRAARIIDLLEGLGAVGEETNARRSRPVIIPPGADPLQFVLSRYQPGHSLGLG